MDTKLSWRFCLLLSVYLLDKANLLDFRFVDGLQLQALDVLVAVIDDALHERHVYVRALVLLHFLTPLSANKVATGVFLYR